MRIGLTKTQKKYLDWIENYLQHSDGVSPSFAEIGKGMNRSASAAHRIAQEIIKRGYLDGVQGMQRTLSIRKD